MTIPEPRGGHHDEEPSLASWCPAAVPGRLERAEVLAEIHRWCTDALTSDEDVPVFGSNRWCAMPDGPTKTRAAVLAALAWWTEQWARSDADAEARREASHAVSAAADWGRIALDVARRPRARGALGGGREG